jgi:hypothetical protein
VAQWRWLAICVPLVILSASRCEALADGALIPSNGGSSMPLCARLLTRNQQCEAGPAPNSWLCDPYPAHLTPRPAWFEFALDAALHACFIRDDIESGHYFCESIRWVTTVESLSWIAHMRRALNLRPDCFEIERAHITFGGSTF